MKITLFLVVYGRVSKRSVVKCFAKAKSSTSTKPSAQVDIEEDEDEDEDVEDEATQELGYEFIDYGRGAKLERFGKYYTSRPAVGTDYTAQRGIRQWRHQDRLIYSGTSGKLGEWSRKATPGWMVSFGRMSFVLDTMSMGQVGVFPEQESNWQWLDKRVTESFSNVIQKPDEKFRVLNGFAYSGGSTMACMVHDQVHVTHLDASKSALTLAATNVNISNCAGSVRWIADDCMTFMQKEVRRCEEDQTRRYHGLIFDPPAFGRFGNKAWSIEQDFPRLISSLPDLLCTNPSFVLLSCHDKDWTAERLKSGILEALNPRFPRGKVEAGEMFVKALKKRGKKLELGSYARWTPK